MDLQGLGRHWPPHQTARTWTLNPVNTMRRTGEVGALVFYGKNKSADARGSAVRNIAGLFCVWGLVI